MSIEILTVGLDEDTIDRLSEAICERLKDGHLVPTESNPPAANPRRTRSRNEPDGPSEPSDPWLNDEPAAEPQPERREPQPRRNQRRQQSQDSGMLKDRFGGTWRLGLLDAPDCECGEKAAKVHAKSQKGNWYDAWKCAKGAPQGDFRNKCDFYAFVPNRNG